MQTTKQTKVSDIAEPKPAASNSQRDSTTNTGSGNGSKKPATPSALSLTALLMKCFEFDADADNESRQLLLDTFEYWNGHQRLYDFNVVMTSKALHSLGVHVGVDRLEVPKFLELLNLFCRAVTGHGYGGLREELIEALLRMGSNEMKFDTAVAIFAQQFEQHHTDLSIARQALKDYPEELADAIRKATETLAQRRQEASHAG